jgi:uncharacterized protein YkwD
MKSNARSLPLVLIGVVALVGCAMESNEVPDGETPPPGTGPGGTGELVPWCDDVATWDPAWTELENQVLTVVNQRRAAGANCNGTNFAPAPALTFDDRLRCSARRHSKDMGVNQFFDHKGSDSSMPGERILRAGYAFTRASENIAAGPATAAAVVDAWMASPSHCPNIMDPQMTNLGTGYYLAPSSMYKHYWTQNFGNRPAPPPPQVTTRPRYDFDGDGKANVAVFRPSDGTWYIQRADGSFYGQPFGVSGDIPVAADYDGDGLTDVAVYRGGSWYRQRSGAGFDAFNYGVPTDIPFAADFDGDGKADAGVFRPSESVWYVLQSSNGQNLIVKFGSEGDVPIPGDFDGDKKADLNVFRPSDSTWYRLNSGDGSFFGVKFGATGDRPITGDFDGDGKADPAVFRPSDGASYILASTTGMMNSVVFGVADDVLVPADYDGDGKDDVAVFRRSNASWYVHNSSNGMDTGVQFGVSTDIPVMARP